MPDAGWVDSDIEICLKYLPHETTEAKLKEYFASCGAITGEPSLMRNPQGGCKGMGWINFARPDGASKALKMNGCKFMGRNLQVTRGRTRAGAVKGTVQAAGTHSPALIEEVLARLVAPNPDGVYIDGTFGRGGHSRGILGRLSKNGAAPSLHSAAFHQRRRESRRHARMHRIPSTRMRAPSLSSSPRRADDGGGGGRRDRPRATDTHTRRGDDGGAGQLHAFDMDDAAVEVGKALEKEDARFHIHKGMFSTMFTTMKGLGLKVDGVLLDIGISSPQLDGDRGFRPEMEGPLDLRFDLNAGVPAYEYLHTVGAKELAEVLVRCGGEDAIAAQRIADMVVMQRETGASSQTLNPGLHRRAVHEAGAPMRTTRGLVGTIVVPRMHQAAECVVVTLQRESRPSAKARVREGCRFEGCPGCARVVVGGRHAAQAHAAVRGVRAKGQGQGVPGDAPGQADVPGAAHPPQQGVRAAAGRHPGVAQDAQDGWQAGHHHVEAQCVLHRQLHRVELRDARSPPTYAHSGGVGTRPLQASVRWW